MKTLTPGEYEEKKSNLTSSYLLSGGVEEDKGKSNITSSYLFFEGGWEEQ